MDEADEMTCLARVTERIGACPKAVRSRYERAAPLLFLATHRVGSLTEKSCVEGSRKTWAPAESAACQSPLDRALLWDPAERSPLTTVLQEEWYVAASVKKHARPRWSASNFTSLAATVVPSIGDAPVQDNDDACFDAAEPGTTSVTISEDSALEFLGYPQGFSLEFHAYLLAVRTIECERCNLRRQYRCWFSYSLQLPGELQRAPAPPDSPRGGKVKNHRNDTNIHKTN